MARDAGNTRQNKRLEQLNRLRAEGDDAALKTMLETPEGRRLVCRIARDSGWMGDPWDDSSRRTDFNLGRQSNGRELMAWAERVAPENFMLALREATQRDVEMNELAKAATTPSKDDDDG